MLVKKLCVTQINTSHLIQKRIFKYLLIRQLCWKKFKTTIWIAHYKNYKFNVAQAIPTIKIVPVLNFRLPCIEHIFVSYFQYNCTLCFLESSPKLCDHSKFPRTKGNSSVCLQARNHHVPKPKVLAIPRPRWIHGAKIDFAKTRSQYQASQWRSPAKVNGFPEVHDYTNAYAHNRKLTSLHNKNPWK